MNLKLPPLDPPPRRMLLLILLKLAMISECTFLQEDADSCSPTNWFSPEPTKKHFDPKFSRSKKNVTVERPTRAAISVGQRAKELPQVVVFVQRFGLILVFFGARASNQKSAIRSCSQGC